jgi:hypothetical protein
MSYLVEILAENRLTDWRSFKKLKPAEDLYFRGFAAVVQQLPIRLEHGRFIRLTGCSLYEVPCVDLTSAKRLVRLNEARRLQSSEDCCGVPVEIDLFRVIN